MGQPVPPPAPKKITKKERLAAAAEKEESSDFELPEERRRAMEDYQANIDEHDRKCTAFVAKAIADREAVKEAARVAMKEEKDETGERHASKYYKLTTAVTYRP